MQALFFSLVFRELRSLRFPFDDFGVYWFGLLIRPFAYGLLTPKCKQNVSKIPGTACKIAPQDTKVKPVLHLTSYHCSTPQRRVDLCVLRREKAVEYWSRCHPCRTGTNIRPRTLERETGISILIPAAVGTHLLMVVRSFPPPLSPSCPMPNTPSPPPLPSVTMVGSGGGGEVAGNNLSRITIYKERVA